MRKSSFTKACETMDCELCGLPTPTPPIESSGKAFCCIGCREVFQQFGDDILLDNSAISESLAQAKPEGTELFLKIDGMHCSSCEILIEQVARRLKGVLSATSSYATSSAKIVYDPVQIDESQLLSQLSVTGYNARLRSDDALEPENDLALFRILITSSMASVVMMLYLAFFYPTNLGLVDIDDLQPMGWLAFRAVPNAIFVLTSILVFYVGAPIFRGALIGIRAGVLNMDNLLAIAILASYGYSIAQMFTGSLDLYFDVTAAIITVVTFGRYFEHGARANATRELTSLMEAWVPVARVFEDGEYQQRGIDAINSGDSIFVWQGEPVPVDGIIVDGQAAVDESLMTGEPFPVTRGIGDKVYGGAVVVEGILVITVGEEIESQMDTLAHILWNIQSSSTGFRGLADRVARVFVPAVLYLAAGVFLVSLMMGLSLQTAVLTGLATLIVSCPCTFGLAIPLATAAGISTALRRGIIITSADAFEKARQFDTVAIDKTGTLSTGKMSVLKVVGDTKVCEYAAAVERLSTHPIAEAIAKIGQRYSASDLAIYPGRGALAMVEGQRVAVGSKLLFEILQWDIDPDIIDSADRIRKGEGVISYVGWDKQVYGAIVTQDASRPEWRAVVDRLKQYSRVAVLTGAENADEYRAHVDDVYTGVPPEAKAAVIRGLCTKGAVVMIGDGSNDAPALGAADLGIAFGTPTTLAADAADVIIPGNRLNKIFDAFEILNTTHHRIRQNLGWALLYNACAIPLALTGYLNPLFAALAMSSSSILVVWNSSRAIKNPVWRPGSPNEN